MSLSMGRALCPVCRKAHRTTLKRLLFLKTKKHPPFQRSELLSLESVKCTRPSGKCDETAARTAATVHWLVALHTILKLQHK